MIVQCKVCPNNAKKCMKSETAYHKRNKIIKKYHYYQTNKIVCVSGECIELESNFAVKKMILNRQQVWNRIAT